MRASAPVQRRTSPTSWAWPQIPACCIPPPLVLTKLPPCGPLPLLHKGFELVCRHTAFYGMRCRCSALVACLSFEQATCISVNQHLWYRMLCYVIPCRDKHEHRFARLFGVCRANGYISYSSAQEMSRTFDGSMGRRACCSGWSAQIKAHRLGHVEMETSS
jgi:hypothetical protein